MPCISSSSSPPNVQHLALIIRALALAQSGALSPNSNAAQVPDGIQKKLVGRVHGILSAALPPAALKELATTIANKESLPLNTHLATLVRSWEGPPQETNFVRGRGYTRIPTDLAITILGSKDRLNELLRPTPNGLASPAPDEANIDELWSQHVVLPTRDQAGEAPLPESLRSYAADYLRAHPAEDPADFFRPFRQVRELAAAIPENIVKAFENGLPFNMLRNVLDEYVSNLPDEKRRRFCQGTHASQAYTRGLRLLSSPLGLALLRNPRVTPDMLFERFGIKESSVLAGLDDSARLSRTSRLSRLGAPRRFSIDKEHQRLPVHTFGVSGHEYVVPQSIQNVAHFEDPGKIWELIDSVVHAEHIEYLFALGGSVPWPVLVKEIDRLIAQYANHWETLAGKRTPWWADRMLPSFLEQSRQNMNPYLLLKHLQPRLGFWTAGFVQPEEAPAPAPASASASAPAPAQAQAQPEQLHFRQHTGDELLKRWTSQGIPLERQVFMGQFMAQGFDESWAREQSKEIDPARLQALFSHGDCSDLKRWLLQSIPPEHRVFMGPFGEGPIDHESWKNVQKLAINPAYLQTLFAYAPDSPPNNDLKAWLAQKLADTAVPKDKLALIPSMIRCRLSAAQMNRILGSVPFERAEAVFGPKASTWQQIRYGLDTPEQLFRRLVVGIESVDDLRKAAEQDLSKISEVRKETANACDQLRWKLHAMETLLADLPADTAHARQCSSIAIAWREAITLLSDQLLQPSLESHSEDQLEQIAHMLAALDEALRANPALQTAPADEPRVIPEMTQFA